MKSEYSDSGVDHGVARWRPYREAAPVEIQIGTQPSPTRRSSLTTSRHEFEFRRRAAGVNDFRLFCGDDCDQSSSPKSPSVLSFLASSSFLRFSLIVAATGVENLRPALAPFFISIKILASETQRGGVATLRTRGSPGNQDHSGSVTKWKRIFVPC